MIAPIEPTAGQEAWTLNDVETRTKRYADARATLAEFVSALNDEIENLKRTSLPRIKELVGRAAQREAELRTLVQTNPDLFASPRTHVFHGIKVGYRKGTGGIDWVDDDQVVKLIEKHFSKDEAELLIKTTKKPIAKALADLDVATLRKLGCTIENTGDVVFIKPTDSALDKIVTALLKDALTEADQN